MNIEQMRTLISTVYDGMNWRHKVAYMSENQVIAVYNDFQKRGLIGRVVEYEPPKGMDRLTEIKEDLDFIPSKSSEENVIQLSIYDLLKEDCI